MSILENKEPLMRVHDVPQLVTWLPVRPNGKRVGKNTVYYWITKGVNGIVCESVYCGKVPCTSEGALRRFLAQISPVTPKSAGARSAGSRQKGASCTQR